MKSHVAYWLLANGWIAFLAWAWLTSAMGWMFSPDLLGLITLGCAGMVGVNLGLAIRERYD